MTHPSHFNIILLHYHTRLRFPYVLRNTSSQMRLVLQLQACNADVQHSCYNVSHPPTCSRTANQRRAAAEHVLPKHVSARYWRSEHAGKINVILTVEFPFYVRLKT